MANIRINAIATTATSMSSDDYFAIDGTTSSTRKMSAATPAFTTVLAGDGTVAVPAISFASDQNTGLYRITTDTIGVAAGGVLLAKVGSDGISSFGLNNQIKTTDYDSSTTIGSIMRMALFTGTGNTSGKLEVYTAGGTIGGILNINTGASGAVNFGNGTITQGTGTATVSLVQTNASGSGKIRMNGSSMEIGGQASINTVIQSGGSTAATFSGLNQTVTFPGKVIHTLSATPVASVDTGTVGTISWDANAIYICIATDTWRRVLTSSW
jgi:hypothetical protein